MEPSTQVSNGYDDPVVAQQAKNLTKAIFQHESGNNFNAVGDAGTSHGAGQWQDATWKAQAQEVLGDANAPMTPQNQSVVAQGSIRKLIKEGKNAAQIAAIWNSGSDQGWENKIGTTTINGQQIHYDVPKYVKDVTDLYHQYKGQTAPPVQDTQSQGGDFLSNVGNHLAGRVGDVGNAISDSFSGKINPASGVLQTVGAGFGAVGDVAGDAINAVTPDFIKKPLGEAVGAVVNPVVNTPAVQGLIQGYQGLNPELRNDLGAVGNIASAVPVIKGAGVLKNLAKGATEGLLTGTKDAVYEAVAPKLTAKETAAAIAKQGTSKSGVLGQIGLNPNKSVQKIAETVKNEVPGFDPSKPITDQIAKVSAAEERIRKDLIARVQKAGEGMIYSPNELKSVLGSIETPISLRGTPFEKQIKPLKDAVMKIAEEKGYKVPNLIDARKEFDNLVEKTWPHLYDREMAPMRSAVKGIRDALTKFTEERLPSDVALRETYLKQTQLIRAIENMAEKAVGSAGEIGTNVLQREAAKHPFITGLVKNIGRGVGLGTGIKGAEDLLP